MLIKGRSTTNYSKCRIWN